MLTAGDLLLYLSIYSFLGWIAEVSYVFAQSQKLENRGFLTGPFLPIYGFGALILTSLVQPYVQNPFLVFVASVVATSLLEYLTSLVLDRLFHVRLWDYSGRPFNLRGRICLQNSLLFGLLGLLLLYVLHPVVSSVVRGLPDIAVISIASALTALLVVDGANSIASLAKVRPALDEMKGTLRDAHAKIETDARKEASARSTRKAAVSARRRAAIGRLSATFPHARATSTLRPLRDQGQRSASPTP